MCGACVTELMVKTGVKQASPSGVATMERCMQRPTLLLCSSIPAADYQDHYQPHIVRFIVYIVRATCSAPAQLMWGNTPSYVWRVTCDTQPRSWHYWFHPPVTVMTTARSEWSSSSAAVQTTNNIACILNPGYRPYQDLILSANIKYSNIEIMR